MINTTINTISKPDTCEDEIITSTQLIILTVNFSVGIIGNLLALYFLWPSKSRAYNAKHRLMLLCLACNDLFAEVGMMPMMYMRYFLPGVINWQTKWFCQIRVIWRLFGLGSGCVAIVMAVERCLALTKPFFYQKHVTIKCLKVWIFGLWMTVVVIACLPLSGFGLYWGPPKKCPNSTRQVCRRYKDAVLPIDKAYAYLYFSFGILLTVSMVWANLSVVRTLLYKSDSHGRGSNPLVRRVSSRNATLTYNAATKEELAFGKLMVLLSVVFIICWVPQLASLLVAQFVDPEKTLSKVMPKIADILLALHFTIDPYFYVIQRWPEIRQFLKKTKLWATKKSSSASSIKTTNAEIQHL